MIQKLLFLIMLTIMTAGGVTAQPKEEQQVAASVEALRKAMIDADTAALASLASPELSYGHSGGKVQTRAEFVEDIKTGKSDFVTIDFSEQSIRIFDKTAIVRHVLTAATNDGGKSGNVKLAVMLVWQKQHSRWVLIARQAVRINP